MAGNETLSTKFLSSNRMQEAMQGLAATNNGENKLLNRPTR